MDVKAKIKALSRKYFNEVVEYRRHIHANPELAFEEFGTAEFVSKKLSGGPKGHTLRTLGSHLRDLRVVP